MTYTCTYTDDIAVDDIDNGGWLEMVAIVETAIMAELETAMQRCNVARPIGYGVMAIY